MGAAGEGIRRRRLEGVTADVVGFRVQATPPHEGAEGVRVRQQDHSVDQLCQGPGRLRSGTHQLLPDRFRFTSCADPSKHVLIGFKYSNRLEETNCEVKRLYVYSKDVTTKVVLTVKKETT